MHSRHNQRLVSRLAQQPVDEHRCAGEVMDGPRLSFIDAEPEGGRKRSQSSHSVSHGYATNTLPKYLLFSM